MEALNNIQETERILQLLEDEASLVKENIGEQETDLSEFADTVKARNKEALALIKDLEEQVESLNQENIQLKEATTTSKQEEELISFLREEVSRLEDHNSELKNKVCDQEKRLKQQEYVINSLQHGFERKVDEMGKEYNKKFEANIKIMKQRIRVAEQLHTENKEDLTRMKERCIVGTSKREITELFNITNKAFGGLEMLFERFGGSEADFLGRIFRVCDEIVVMKDRIKDKKDVHTRLMRKMNELQKRVNELEESSMEKEEAFLEIVEEKKEVIRQLSISIEYHKNRWNELLSCFRLQQRMNKCLGL